MHVQRDGVVCAADSAGDEGGTFELGVLLGYLRKLGVDGVYYFLSLGAAAESLAHHSGYFIPGGGPGPAGLGVGDSGGDFAELLVFFFTDAAKCRHDQIRLVTGDFLDGQGVGGGELLGVVSTAGGGAELS